MVASKEAVVSMVPVVLEVPVVLKGPVVSEREAAVKEAVASEVAVEGMVDLADGREGWTRAEGSARRFTMATGREGARPPRT
jgi:hypothetical protein